jgi:hypothetical protein
VKEHTKKYQKGFFTPSPKVFGKENRIGEQGHSMAKSAIFGICLELFLP